jgi:hypothetical protein
MKKSGNILQQAVDAIRRILGEVSAIEHLDIQPIEDNKEQSADLIAQIDASCCRHTLVVKVNSNGQPRQVRPAVLMLKDYATRQTAPVIPVLIAPYLSTQSQDLCKEYAIAFIDLHGNARLAFGTFFILRHMESKPTTERRDLRSLFNPKSAQVLRRMLREPTFAWRVTELAKVTGVSLGHVSNVRAVLLQREWARVSNQRIFLSNPNALLDAWCEAYTWPTGKRYGFYTPLSGVALTNALRALPPACPETGQIMQASFSAAAWIAPYARIAIQYFYADAMGLERLRSALALSVPTKSENIVVTVLDEPGLFLDAMEPAVGITCTSLVETYLELAHSGERGKEAADFFRQQKLKWSK